jgi:hypothetical protein
MMNGEYAEKFYLQLDGKLRGDFKHCGDVDCSDDYVLQQFTGLRDKNDKEIYEGDIIHRFGHCSLMAVPSIDDYKEIKWWSEGGRWNYIPVSDCSYKVVGNIFENPELLEQ